MPPTSPFLRAAPPPWAIGALAWVVIVTVVAALVAAVGIRVPETVSSEFVLVPVRGVDPVRAARPGRVIDVRVAEGAAVALGQTLFVIRSSAVGDQSAELAALETQLRGAQAARANRRERYEERRRADDEQARGLSERRARLLERVQSHRALRASRETRHQTSLRMAESEVASARAEIDFKSEQLALTREIAARYKSGFEANFLSWQEYIRTHIEASRTAVELEQLQRIIDIATLKIAQLRAEHETAETEWKIAMAALEDEGSEIRTAAERLHHESQARTAEYRELDRRLVEDMEKATIRRAAVHGALGGARGDELAVAAPCAGSVVRMVVKRHDAVVQEGEVLSEVACSGEQLQAELLVPPSGIGKIKVSQNVKLKYQAFPYERYGIRHAAVTWVSAIGGPSPNGPSFRVLAALDTQVLRIDGQLQPLLAGMGGGADVVVGRRSVASYAVEPLRRIRETLSAGPPR